MFSTISQMRFHDPEPGQRTNKLKIFLRIYNSRVLESHTHVVALNLELCGPTLFIDCALAVRLLRQIEHRIQVCCLYSLRLTTLGQLVEQELPNRLQKRVTLSCAFVACHNDDRLIYEL